MLAGLKKAGTLARGALVGTRSWEAGEEPRLDEMLQDPVVRFLMARDRVAPEELRALVSDMRERLLAQAA